MKRTANGVADILAKEAARNGFLNLYFSAAPYYVDAALLSDCNGP